jgi:tetratricopeptide (TPR) repeat protein
VLLRIVSEVVASLRRKPVPLRAQIVDLIERDAGEQALALAQASATQDSRSYEAQYCVALARHKLHDSARALDACDTARLLRADDPELHDLRGAILQECGRLEEAVAEYDRAIALQPALALPRFHRALAALLAGDFERGWDGYELRRLNSERHQSTLGIPEWDGTPLAGRTLCVTREQGLGDEIMFASLLPEVMANAQRVLVECDPRLVPLFQRSFPGAVVFPSRPDGSAPEYADVAVGAGSLPRFLRRHASSFPHHGGYLRADPARVEHWRQRLSALGPGLKVGVSWTGGVRKTRRALRSLELSQWAPILLAPGVRFVSLQYTAGAAAEAAASGVQHWQEAIDNLEDTAALVCALDLVVSVCTSVVHLAGALGRPAWVLTPFAPEWRYGVAGESMLWYPSVRLFRQAAHRDWSAPIAAVAAQLRDKVP